MALVVGPSWIRHKPIRLYRRPVSFNEIYVDDFIQGVQGNEAKRKMHQRKLLHSVDTVFRPLSATDRSRRQPVPSIKKMKKGDSCLTTRKLILGWIIDTLQGTLELPPHRKLRLQEIFDTIKSQSKIRLSTCYEACH